LTSIKSVPAPQAQPAAPARERLSHLADRATSTASTMAAKARETAQRPEVTAKLQTIKATARRHTGGLTAIGAGVVATTLLILRRRRTKRPSLRTKIRRASRHIARRGK
jgi:hypothetical protein